MHWNGEKQPHKGILRAKLLIFQGANPIFDVGSLSQLFFGEDRFNQFFENVVFAILGDEDKIEVFEEVFRVGGKV